MRKLLDKYKNSSIIVRATIWFMICGVMQKGIAMLTTPIFTRLLSTEEYGQYSLYNSWLTILTIFCTFRLEKSVFNKGMSKYSDEKDLYTASMQVATNILTSIVFVIYLLFRKQVNQLTELSTFITCAMFLELFFTPAMSFFCIRQRYDYKYKSVVTVTLLYTFLNSLVGVIAVYLSREGQRGIARITSCIITAICFGLILYIHNIYKSRFRIKFEFIKFAVLFNIPLIPHYFSAYILEQSDRLMIQKFCGTSYVGIYTVAYNIGLIMKLITDSLHSAMTPWQYEKMKTKEYIAINIVLFPLLLIVASLTILFMAFAPEIVLFMAPGEYSTAIYIIPPVSGSVFFVMLYGMFSNLEFYYGENKFSSLMTFIGGGLNIILNFIFIRIFGFIAAGYTTLICYTIFAYTHFFYANHIAYKKEGIPILPIKQINILTILVYSAVIVLSMVYNTILIRYLIIVVVSLIVLLNKKKVVKLIKTVKK